MFEATTLKSYRGTETQRKATEKSKVFSVFPLCLCVSAVDFLSFSISLRCLI